MVKVTKKSYRWRAENGDEMIEERFDWRKRRQWRKELERE